MPDAPRDATDPDADKTRLEAQRVARLKKRWLVAVVVGLPLMQFARLLAFDGQGHLRTWDAVVQAAKSLFGP
jgi:hypothetical protein